MSSVMLGNQMGKKIALFLMYLSFLRPFAFNKKMFIVQGCRTRVQRSPLEATPLIRRVYFRLHGLVYCPMLNSNLGNTLIFHLALSRLIQELKIPQRTQNVVSAFKRFHQHAQPGFEHTSTSWHRPRILQ